MSTGIDSNPGNNAPVNPPPNSPSTADASALSGWGWAAAILALGIVVGLVVLAGFWTYQRFQGTPFVPDASAQQTEAKFQRFVFDSTDSNPADPLDEWRAVRSDHKIIAYAVARCLGLAPGDSMTQAMFSLLMLDLHPNGDHWWGRGSRKGSSEDTNAAGPRNPAEVETSSSQQENQPSPQPFKQLTGIQATMLALSDEIGRARLSAARGANDFYPKMFYLGWASVIVSAIATAFVTLKASMNSQHYPKWSMVFGILAVGLSTIATMLAGTKQFFDPTGAYMRNESALVGLRQLHSEIALDFLSRPNLSNCDGASVDERSFVRWRNTLVSLENGTIFAPVIVAPPTNPLGQSADNSGSESIPTGSKPERPATRVSTPPVPSGENASAEPK